MRTTRKHWTEERSFAFRLDSVDESGTFEGVASVFGNPIDTYPPTRVLPGAFTRTLAENFRRIKILYQHDLTQPIGLPVLLREDAEGLFIKGELGRSALAQSVREDIRPLPLAQRPILDELSIGFDAVREEFVREEGASEPVRLLKEVALWEVSIVTWGADNKARIRAAHALPFRDLPLAPESTPFVAADAMKRVADWAGGDEGRLAQAFLVQGAETAGEWLIADVIDGRLVAVPEALYRAAHAVSTAGFAAPDDVRERTSAHLDRYYRKLGRLAPWDRRRSFLALALEPALSLPIESRTSLTDEDRRVIRDAIAALEALVPVAKEAEEEPAAAADDGAAAAESCAEQEDEAVAAQLLEMEVSLAGVSVGMA